MRHSSLFFGVLMVGLLAGARPAAADVPPLGACGAGEVGDPCYEAVDESGQVVGAGICVAERCKRVTPSGPMTYDCAMCRPKSAEPSAGGAANDPVQPTAGAGEEPVKPSAAEKPEAEDGGGCSMSAAGRGAGSAALASLLVLGLALARRRAQRGG